ncbi:MAG: hypothetical protein ACOXZZ_03700 [Sphaerochaetaceae bacterium]
MKIKNLFVVTLFLLLSTSIFAATVIYDQEYKEIIIKGFLDEIEYLNLDQQINLDIKEFSIDDKSFKEQQLYQGILGITTSKGTFEYKFALLVDHKTNIEQLIYDEIRIVVRNNTLTWFDKIGENVVDEVTDGGIWTIANTDSFKVGSRLYLVDGFNEKVALVGIANKFDNQGQTLYELKPFWSKERIKPALKIDSKRLKGDSSLSVFASLNSVGLGVVNSFALKNTFLQIATTIDIEYQFKENSTNLLFFSGIERTHYLGEFNLHALRNVRLSMLAQVGLGVHINSTETQFLYGAKGEIRSSYQLSSNFYLGLGVSYRYTQSKTFSLGRVSVSSLVGWMW